MSRTVPGSLVASQVAVLERVAAGAAKDSGVPADLLGEFLSEATMAIVRGRRLSAGRVSLYSRHGADAAARNVELAALVDLYLSAAWRLWREVATLLPDLPDAARPFVDAGDGILRTSDDVVAAVAAGYQQAREVLLLQNAADRRDFVDDLLSNSGLPGELRDRGEAFGLRLIGLHVVCVIVREGQRIDDSHPLVGNAAAICRSFPEGSTSLVATKDGRLVVVLASPDGGTDVGEVATQLARHDDHLRAAVGRHRPGDSGPMRSYRDALDCLTVASRLGVSETLSRADDLLVYLALLHDRDVLVDLVQSVLLPLTELRGGAASHLETLHAYFDNRGIATATAAALHLSVRGFTYRLERMRRVLRHDLDDPRQRLTIELALTAAQLLEWPSQPIVAIT